MIEAFNNYFAKIGRFSRQNSSNGNTSYANYLVKPVLNCVFMNEIDCLLVINIVKTLEPQISSGLNDLSATLIKETIFNIIHTLTYIRIIF